VAISGIESSGDSFNKSRTFPDTFPDNGVDFAVDERVARMLAACRQGNGPVERMIRAAHSRPNSWQIGRGSIAIGIGPGVWSRRIR
jgi:hypothetical protein